MFNADAVIQELINAGKSLENAKNVEVLVDALKLVLLEKKLIF